MFDEHMSVSPGTLRPDSVAFIARQSVYGVMETKLLANPTDPSAWQQALYAFLAEKERRSGSRRTVESYSRMLQQFFGQAGKTPDRVTSPDVLGWAHGIGLSGRTPSAITIGARVACLSSFYKHQSHPEP